MPQQINTFGFLQSIQPLVVPLSKKYYKLLSHFFELMLQEQEELEEENLLVTRNLLQIMMVNFTNRTDFCHFLNLSFK